MAAPLKKRKRIIRSQKIKLPEGTVIDYKDPALLQKFLSDRGKLLSRRITGVNAKMQRDITTAVKRARFLGLLSVGSSKR